MVVRKGVRLTLLCNRGCILFVETSKGDSNIIGEVALDLELIYKLTDN